MSQENAVTNTLKERDVEYKKQEKHAGQVQVSAYKQFCDDASVEKKSDIKEADERIEVLRADLALYIATAAQNQGNCCSRR